MCLTIFKGLFILISFLLTVLLIVREFGITKKLSPMKASDYISAISGLMLFYIVSAFLLAILTHDLKDKFVMLFFGFSPFIIGRLVTYQKVKIYSIIQILCVIFSLGYTFLI